MIYEYDLVVAADTKEASPASVEMELSHGIVHKLEVSFPGGCKNTVKVVINRALHQVWPTNPDGQIKANGFTVSFPVWYELEEAPYLLTAWAWAPGTTYSHTVTIRLGIQRREHLQLPREEMGIIRRLGALILGRGG